MVVPSGRDAPQSDLPATRDGGPRVDLCDIDLIASLIAMLEDGWTISADYARTMLKTSRFFRDRGEAMTSTPRVKEIKDFLTRSEGTSKSGGMMTPEQVADAT